MDYNPNIQLYPALLGRQVAPLNTLNLVPTAPKDRFPTTSLQQGAFAIILLFTSFALAVVALRIYIRLRIKQLGGDDVFICLAMMFSIAECCTGYIAIKTSFIGIHSWDIPWDSDKSLSLFWNFMCQILYNPILAMVKTSVLLFLLRLGGVKKNVRITIHSLNALNIALAIGIFVSVIFQCKPIDYFWKQAGAAKGQGTCFNTSAFYIATASITILTDIAMLILPIWMFMGLNMALRLKLALTGVFLVGAIVTVIGILRLVWLVDIIFPQSTGDFSYDIRFIYSAIETNLAIIAACAPALRPLLKVWFPKLFSTTDNKPSAVYGGQYGVGVSTEGKGSKATHRRSSIPLKEMSRGTLEIGGVSPSGSEEQIMTYNGIVRTTEVEVHYEKSDSNMDRTLSDTNAREHRLDF